MPGIEFFSLASYAIFIENYSKFSTFLLFLLLLRLDNMNFLIENQLLNPFQPSIAFHTETSHLI